MKGGACSPWAVIQPCSGTGVSSNSTPTTRVRQPLAQRAGSSAAMVVCPSTQAVNRKKGNAKVGASKVRRAARAKRGDAPWAGKAMRTAAITSHKGAHRSGALLSAMISAARMNGMLGTSARSALSPTVARANRTPQKRRSSVAPRAARLSCSVKPRK